MDLMIIVLTLTVGFAIIIWFINRNSQSKDLLEVIKLLQVGSKEDRQILLDSLQKNTSSLNARLDAASRVILDVQKNVGEMSEIGRSMKSLQEFLQSPKLRGNIGEHVLGQLLKDFLPRSSFHLQYTFKSGEKVDAAIKTEAGLIPIDSKFPMENFRALLKADESEKQKYQKLFNRDIKKHIKDISNKYILTAEGTIDYALMYIPSEAVYYEVVNDHDLFDYASSMRVLPVSPSTFYAYMRAILMSFEGQKIEQQAKKLLGSLRAIQKDYEKVENNISVMGRHLTNANNMFKNVVDSFEKLGNKISDTKSLGDGLKD